MTGVRLKLVEIAGGIATQSVMPSIAAAAVQTAGSSNPPGAVAWCRLPHYAHRQMASRLSAALQSAEERVRRVLRHHGRLYRLLHASWRWRRARPLRGRDAGRAAGLCHRHAERAGDRFCRGGGRGAAAVFPQPPLYGAALAVVVALG